MQGQYILEDPKSMTNVIGQIIDGITSFISLVTSLSLFVGGIGVMNIMYVSVSERKREIGIKRAIGAKSKDILIQFIFEASFITGVAGLIGIICGFVFSKIVGVMLPFNPVITLNNFIIASTTSILVGVIFGIMPAIKASNMEPINAIYN